MGNFLSRLFKRSDPVKDTKSLTFYQFADGFTPIQNFQGGLPTGLGQASNPLTRYLEASVWSYCAMSANADAAGALEPGVQREGRDKESRWVFDRAHPLREFLKYPLGPGWEDGDWGWSRLVATIMLHLQQFGYAYLLKLAPSGKLLGLLPLNPSLAIDPETGSELQPTSASVVRFGSLLVARESLVRIVLPSSWGGHGRSPFRAALDSVKTSDILGQRQSSNLANRVAPGLILSLAQPFAPSTEERKALMDWLRDNYGQATQDGRPMVIHEDAKLLNPPDQKQNLDFAGIRSQTKEEILACFGVPEQIFGRLDSASTEAYRAILQAWYTITVLPMLRTVYDAINRQAIWPEFGPTWRLWYDLSGTEIGLVLMSERLKVAKQAIDCGWPANDAGAMVDLGLPWHPELDVPNVSWVTAGRKLAGEEGTQPTEETEAPKETVPVPTEPGKDIQSEALNGAQMAELRATLVSIRDGELAPEAAKVQILRAFPLFSAEEVGTMVAAQVSIQVDLSKAEKLVDLAPAPEVVSQEEMEGDKV